MTKDFVREFAGIAMVISFMLCYVPQIYKMIKTKRSADVSPCMVFLGVAGYVFGLIYMGCTKFGIWWFLNYTTGIVSSAVLLYFYYKYVDKDGNPK